MMEALARQLARRSVAAAVVLLVLGLAALAGVYALKVDQDDDLLAFLPKDNSDVGAFYDINKLFGGLDVAIVGIEVGDPFEAAFLSKLKRLTNRLNDEEVIASALSLTNVEDFTAAEGGGVRADYLTGKLPETAEEKAKLRARVMSKNHIVGNLVSRDGKSVIIYNFLAPGADPRNSADLIRGKVRGAFPEHTLYWGGTPFISTYIYDTTQADMRRLIPWAVVVIVLIVIVSFRDVVGALLVLVSTGVGILFAHGLMGASGVNANIVLSSMPVILFAVGSAYGIHILVRYYSLRRDSDCPQALVGAMTQVGPTVLAAGLTTVAGLLSFMAMDIEPMREFGLFTGLGILATLILSLTFIPAFIRLTELKSRSLGKGLLRDALARSSVFAHKQRGKLALLLALLTFGGATLAGRVEARMETSAFFSKDSPPDRAERFLREHFGGSQFIQVMVEGDLNDPDVLREVQRLSDRIAVHEHVSSVNDIAKVVAMVNEAMAGERRIPVTTAQVRVLYRFLQGRTVLKQLLGADRRRALIHVKIDSDEYEVVDTLLRQIEQLVSSDAVTHFRIVGRVASRDEAPNAASLAISEADREALQRRRLATVQARIGAYLAEFDVALRDGAPAVLAAHLQTPAPATDRERVREQLAEYLRSDESLLEEDQRPLAASLAGKLATLGPKPDGAAIASAVAAVLERSLALPEGCAESTESERSEACQEALDQRDEQGEMIADVAASLPTPIAERWRRAQAGAGADALLTAVGVTLPEGERGRQMRAGLAAALLDQQLSSGLLPAPAAEAQGSMKLTVNGMPVLNRGLSKSVTANQFKSLGLALGLVLLIMMALFRSVTAGLLAAAPMVLTLLVIYGIMGIAGLHLDIGTSMLASIIIGAGVDYAVHLLAAWRADEGEDLSCAARNAAAQAGPAIWTNALMVCAGFFVLTLGEAKPLQNVGGLTAAAMITAALATFVALPVLARKRRYGRL